MERQAQSWSILHDVGLRARTFVGLALRPRLTG
jgi:hypothetical protein